MTRRLSVLLAFAAMTAARPAWAALSPAPPGASSCSGCHMANGALPSITGRSTEEITAMMAAFRSGERPATLMNRIAKGFTEPETRAIAAWLSEQAPGR